MKKNLKRCLLALSVAVAAIAGFTACQKGGNQGETPSTGDHTHQFKTEWAFDNEYHWHAADCGHDVQDGKAKHELTERVDKAATCSEAGSATYSCTCGYSYTDTIATIAHTYPEAWEFDDAKHWQVCEVCGEKTGEGAHVYVSGACSTCKASRDEVLEKIYKFEADGDTAYVVAGLTADGAKSTSLNIPTTYKNKSVTGIKANAFDGNKVLTEVTVPSSVLTIGREAFMNCTALKKVVLSSGLTTIAETAFAGCAALTDIGLPASLVSIGACAFDGCAALEEIDLPSGLKTLGEQAFANCSKLKAIVVPAIDAVQLSKDKTRVKLNDRTFMNCTSLATVTLPSSLEIVGASAFLGCTALSSITLPDGLKEVSHKAFKGSGLTAIVVPDSVEIVANSAFAGCASLVTAKLGTGMNYHFGAIFADCASLATLTVPFVGSNVSADDAVTAEFGYYFGTTAPATNESAYRKVGQYYIPKALTNVSVLGGTIDAAAFDGCEEIETIGFAKNVVVPAELTGCNATLVQLGKPEVTLTVGASAYVNEAIAISVTSSRGSSVTIAVKKGADEAVSGTDYEISEDKTEITFKAVGSFTVTATASANGETTDATATVAVDVRGPELTNVALDKEEATTETDDFVTLSYEAGEETVVAITSVTKNDAAATKGTDYDYDEETKKFTFHKGGVFEITVTGSRNGKTVDRKVSVTISNTNALVPTVTVTATTEVVENNEVTIEKTYTCEDAVASYAYAIFVQKGENFENASEESYEWIGEAGARTGFKPLIAGTYKVRVTATTGEGGVGSGEATVTVTAAEITLAWADGVESGKTNGWLRVANDGGDIAYTVTGYSFGYEATFSVDDAAASATAADGSATAVHVSTTASNTATVKVVYTHKTDSSKKQEISIPVSFVSDLANAPILAADPFGGTCGTLIPSTGLQLYYGVTDKDGNAIANYAGVEYEVAAEALQNAAANTTKIYKVQDLAAYPYVIVEDFDGAGNDATGTVTVKMTVTVDGETAAASKVFECKPLGNGEGKIRDLNTYVSMVHERGDLNLSNMAMDQRQNMVVSKDQGVIVHRGQWGSGTVARIDINTDEAISGGTYINNFSVEFTIYALGKDANNKCEVAFYLRTGNWNGWSDERVALFSDSNVGFYSGVYGKTDGGFGNCDWTGNFDNQIPEGTNIIGQGLQYKIERRVTDGKVALYTYWRPLSGGDWVNGNYSKNSVDVSTAQGNAGSPVASLQVDHVTGCYAIGNVKVTNLDA